MSPRSSTCWKIYILWGTDVLELNVLNFINVFSSLFFLFYLNYSLNLPQKAKDGSSSSTHPVCVR